ncbi:MULTISPECIES: hypothetical protein [Actinomycetes]|uniref:hypothetical protein n=1 Tax=Actinomycetes TaxID=1760 RepID=UPI0035DA878C
MRIRKSPSSASIEHSRTQSTEDLRYEYELIKRTRTPMDVDAIADQNDIARELERRGEL